jgi:hypothetical protein
LSEVRFPGRAVAFTSPRLQGNVASPPTSLTMPSGDSSTAIATTAFVTQAVAAAPYLTGNQTITLSGYATGSGTTAIPVTVARVKGVTDGSDAAAGDAGEYGIVQVPFASRSSIAANTVFSLASIALTAGDWNVWGNILFVPGSGAVVNNIQVGINTVSTAMPDTSLTAVSYVSAANLYGSAATPVQRVSLTTTTNVYVIGFSGWTGAGCTACGFIAARRVR